MKIAFIGAGNVGGALAHKLVRLGHDVTLAASDEGKEAIAKAIARDPKISVTPPKTAVSGAEIVFLATPFAAYQTALGGVASELEGKILVDCTNPVGPGLSHGLASAESGSQAIQRFAPKARVVKAFTIYGFENLEDTSFPKYDVKPVMMFCGQDANAKTTVGTLIGELGFEPLDVGGLEQALHLEHMTLLWVRMVRMNKHSPHLVWAALRR